MTKSEYDLQWSQIPKHAKHASDLDQAELNAWQSGVGSIEDGVSDERCSSELIDDSVDFDEDALTADAIIADDLIGGALEQSEARKEDLDDSYPFLLDDGRLTHLEGDQHWAYRFCLLASLAGQFDSQESRRLRACFELLVRDAAMVYWGKASSGFRSGHPWDIYANEHFRSTKAVYKSLYKNVGDDFDWLWRPKPDVDSDPSYLRSKDLGVDVVVWRPWPDTRGGQHYLLVQCATTQGEVISKADDIKKSRLNDYMDLPCNGFAKAIATPSCILNSSAIRQISKQAGLVFDRSRIVKIVGSADWNDAKTDSQEECISLINEIIKD